MLAAVGGVIGVVLGALLPFLISWTFRAIMPLPIEPALHPAELVLALVYGLMTALAFALWPLGRAHDVPVGALFRDAVAPQPRWPRKTYIALTALAVLALVALAVGWPTTGASREPHLANHSDLEAEVAQSTSQIVLDGDGLGLQ